ncbi:MAG: hypothetical protein F2734_01560 [Actinobacteria bacterium]|uniref:Unannotated protein n=1 Tax=freshwater metagenome TaxID=449393 RepID=A0A6J6WRG2_9ZZZZ|nr:hypothetical protein [Actinomycetota bacterium]
MKRKLDILLAVLLILTVSVPSTSEATLKPATKATAKPIPSPTPLWPPTGFVAKDGVYAKIPTGKELTGVLSAKTALASEVKLCKKYACGAVIVAAEKACQWWEIHSVVYGPTSDVDTATVRYGTIKTIAKSTYSRELKVILLISKEPLITGIYISGIKIMCQRGATIIPYPSSSYLPDPARLKTSG